MKHTTDNQERMDGHLYDVQHILKYGQKLDLSDVHYEQQFKPTTLLTDI